MKKHTRSKSLSLFCVSRCYISHSVLSEKPKDHRYRFSVPIKEKLSLISDFMSCKFDNYTDIIASPVSRSFIFKQPFLALGRHEGRISPMMLEKIYLRKGKTDEIYSQFKTIKNLLV